MTHTGSLSLQAHVLDMDKTLRVQSRNLHRVQIAPPASLGCHRRAAPSRTSMGACRHASSSSLRALDATPTVTESIYPDLGKGPDRGSEEHLGLAQAQEGQQQQQVQDPQEQQQQHGPGRCACCRPPRIDEPIVHVVTYVDGVVLEVETADGDVVYFQQEEEYEGTGVYGVKKPLTTSAVYGPTSGGAGSGGPLVFVPDLIIPPPSDPSTTRE
ncbi:hypothetical protein VaNZ11_005294 [Volvox africanus]|uniref:Uncharacterized protein n=1 Tax=Volvox africanus TaxID=51714 RepID=A0ABQ5RZP4_9CHLO|nr:hypothetical protein VaNZ11_005294 [Volvox africanus]